MTGQAREEEDGYTAGRFLSVSTRRVPVQRAVERDEIPYPHKVHDTTLHGRA